MLGKKNFGERWVHDPSIIHAGDAFYTVSTHGYYQFRKSYDLISWEDEGKSCFDKESIARELKEGIEYCKASVPKTREEGSNFWAPDIIKVGDKYRLYYAISSFGSPLSYIGMAESDKIDGEYHQKGCVVKSKEGVPFPNAIDPSAIRDKNGKFYLVYGSFFGGIFLKELKKNGLAVDEGYGIKLAGGDMEAIEGPCLLFNKENGYYYLFLSYGSLVDSYNVRVARAKKITGPYIDPQGRRLDKVKDGGAIILTSYHFSHQKDTFTAPGHNDVLKFRKNCFLAHHTRLNNDPSVSYLNIRQFAFNKFGWPVVFPSLYNGEKLRTVSEDISGKYNVIKLNTHTTVATAESKLIDLKIKVDGYFVEVEVEGEKYYGVAVKVLDAGEEKYAISAMNKKGYCVWGIKSPF